MSLTTDLKPARPSASRSPTITMGRSSLRWPAKSLHIIALYLPSLSGVLNARPVAFMEWVVLFGIALSILVAGEILKMTRRPYIRRRIKREKRLSRTGLVGPLAWGHKDRPRRVPSEAPRPAAAAQATAPSTSPGAGPASRRPLTR